MLAAPDDIPDLVRIINAAYEVEKFFVSGDRTDPETVRRLMSKGVFLKESSPQGVNGCVYVELRGERAYFGMLAVDPSLQGTGLGRRLVQEAEQYARDHGCRAMDIRVVNLREELPAFYRKLGYVERDMEAVEEPRALQPFHFIVMSKTLT